MAWAAVERRSEVNYVLGRAAASFSLLQLIDREARYKEQILRSKDNASVVVLTNCRSRARIQCSRAGARAGAVAELVLLDVV